MKQVHCSGKPRQIGYSHGTAARDQVHGSIAFYSKLFQEKCSMSWDEVTAEANKYVDPLQATCSRYLEEIEGLAEGAGVSFLDVLALNVRTEIMFGLFTDPTNACHADIPSDGCTSLGWVDASGQSFLAQNWDWQSAQGPNLIVCHISQPDTKIPNISMVTEAGIIGKIGFNADGVGCCLNAIRARGVDATKLPVHFALRTVLESPSREKAVAQIKTLGVAGSAHILVADHSGSTGLECTPFGIKEIAMDTKQRVYHTNHLILEHPGVDEPPWLEDSRSRLSRIEGLADTVTTSKVETRQLFEMFKDEEGCPCSINRKQEGPSGPQTLFTIIMSLGNGEALVKFGRPTEDGEEIRLVP
ncbi:hypothetical protein N0V93_008686 [Gnomoniopsis smithogilvyi]|uniref:Peptidase C45 hydrolase domain-containing protein n=1 Tax=Gnomoniopsis smithogilvyi TaxID=1191159 RepID=A0A9W9CU48_9PEZI|nr:hypothetical protein N0V93_008686 [Gnomoniopsis smithogilvyi]